MQEPIENKGIIIAEDNPSDLELTKLALGELCLVNPLLHINNGQFLIDYLEDNSNRESTILIILDLDLNTSNGMAFLKHASDQNWFEQMNIVVFTNKISKDQIVFCKELGVQSICRKPINLEEYFSAVQRLLSYWLFQPALRN